MEYLFILGFQLSGISLNVLQKIIGLGSKYPGHSIKQIITTFFAEDWDTLAVSGVVLFLNELVHFVLVYYEVSFISWEYFPLLSCGIALVLGWAGQRKIYEWLGTAEKKLDKIVNEKLNG